MEILIKDKEFFGHGLTKRWADTMNSLRGQWVEVDTEFLFCNQFNIKTARVMSSDIDGIRDDVRVYRKFCHFCHHHSSLVAKRCEYCNMTNYFTRFFPKKEKHEIHS